MNRIKFKFIAPIWQHNGVGGWYFMSLPVDLAKEIRNTLGFEEQGWGRLSVTARIGNTEWKTAIWFDTKLDTYLLPLKAEVRRRESLEPGRQIEAILWI